MKIKDPLSPADADRARILALEASQAIGKAKFTVFATLDIEKPWTINNFDTFGRVLLAAYKQGAASVDSETA